jgi:hypothetical protein
MTVRDDEGAQAALDAIGLDRLSIDGAILMRAVAERFGIPKPQCAIGTTSLPWGIGNLGAQISLFDAFSGAARELEKAWDPTKHPRWPAGAPDSQGGRFRPVNNDGDPNSEVRSAAETPPPGIGDNEGPPFDDLPDIPSEEPTSAQLRNTVVKGLARWALRRGIAMLIPGIGEAVGLLQIAEWIYDALPYINAYLDAPTSLEELQDAANNPQEGYQIHHVVEQTPARQEGFPESQIESRENKVRISTLKHWQITGWYNMSNENYGGLSPRQYLGGKDWVERTRVGRDALILFGVLKP